MLLVAGTIEGFFSPLRLPASDRIAVGAVTAVLLVAYFSFAGLKQRARFDAQVFIDCRDRELFGRDVEYDDATRWSVRAATVRSAERPSATASPYDSSTSRGDRASAAPTAASFMKMQSTTWRLASVPSSASTALCATGSMTSVKNAIKLRRCRCERR